MNILPYIKNKVSQYLHGPENHNGSKVDIITGDYNQYMDDVLPKHLFQQIKKGESRIICAPTGSGKTTALVSRIVALRKSIRVVYLVNRSMLALQIKAAILRQNGIDTTAWPSDAIMAADLGNIMVMTYQAAAKYQDCFRSDTNDMVIICDEVHYLLNDAIFSFEPMMFYSMLQNSISYSKRIYISATISEVYTHILGMKQGRLTKCYTMCADNSHLRFRYYDYDNTNSMIDAVESVTANEEKAVVFVRNKKRGQELADRLSKSTFVYANMDDRGDLEEIARTEQFSDSSIVSTRVLDNGVSITDEQIKHIIIEEIDPIAWIQMLGRIRRQRNNPSPLTVWIPDYSRHHLNQMHRHYSEQLRLLEELGDDFLSFMERPERLQPWMLQTMNNKLQVNSLAICKLRNMTDHLAYLIEEETHTPNAHIRFIRTMLQLEELSEKDFLDYDELENFRSHVTIAFTAFQDSPMLEADRKVLEKALINVVQKSNVYPKKITGTSIHLSSVNAILRFAGVDAEISELGKAYKVNNNTEGGNLNDES